jgi:glutathione synthase/RimK-type ligase-like ATP-grasp enzyme
MKAVGFVTYKQSSKLTESDQFIVPPLKKRGFEAHAVAWDDTRIDWTRFDVIVLRSCWNYHLHYEQFLAWLNRIKRLKVPVWNPIPVIRWNSNKKYLKDLEYKGVPVIPTVFIEKGTTYFLSDIAKHKGWKDLVIKPAIGASSYNVCLVKQNEYDKKQNEFVKLSGQSDVCIQPFVKEIYNGEYSLIFLGNQYSHAVLKIPKKGDFRSNCETGGAEKRIEPEKRIIQQAANIVKTIHSPLLYARVDGIILDGKFTLSELELIEPELYFYLDPLSPAKFAKTLARYTSETKTV